MKTLVSVLIIMFMGVSSFGYVDVENPSDIQKRLREIRELIASTDYEGRVELNQELDSLYEFATPGQQRSINRLQTEIVNRSH